MKNTKFFHLQHAPGVSFYIAGFDSAVNSGSCSIGVFEGGSRSLPAVVLGCATEDDNWHVVNLQKDHAHFDSVAVLGAVNDEQAQDQAMLYFGRMFDSAVSSVIETNSHGLKRHLDKSIYHHKKLDIQAWQLDELQDVLTAEKPMWDSANSHVLTSHSGSMAVLMLDLMKHDDENKLIQEFDGLPQLLTDIGGVEVADFDSIITQYQHLERMQQFIHTEMKKASVADLTVVDTETTKPFKRNGVAQIAIKYGFSDGQNVVVFFHNPDSAPSKLSPTDVLVSWKIQLNNRDVTGLVQPAQGEGLKASAFATRMMQLLLQNTSRFKRAQAKKAESNEKLANAELLAQQKQQELDDLDQEIATLTVELDQIKVEQPQVEPKVIVIDNVIEKDKSVEKTQQKDETVNQTVQNTSELTQDDIDYLNDVISGSITPDDVDMDRMISIAEKDEENTLFLDALDIVEKFIDELSK